MTEYNKLVRDNIPEIILSCGEIPVTRTLEPEEYLLRLEEKLDEEVREFHESKVPEELADILEVVYALAESQGCTREALQALYEEKHAARGGFSKRILLIRKKSN